MNFAGSIIVLSSGLAAEGQLASATDTDRYRIQAAESGVMTIALDVPTADTSNNYFVLQVYDASGTQLAQYRTGQDRTVAVGVPQVGAYDIVVQAESSYRYDGNAYKLTATLAAGGAQGYESEANESATAADADPLSLGGLTRGQLATSSDKDYYQVTVNAKGILTVELDVPTNSTSDKPYRLRLLDTDGAGQLFDNNYGTGQDSTYALELPKAGTYFLELSSYYSSALKESAYALKSSFSAGATGGKELEINDSKADADPISSGVKVSGNLGKSSDEDYYRLDVAAAGVLSVLLDVPSSLSGGGYRYEYFRLSVYDAQDTLLGQYNTSADKTYRFAAETAGSYYLVVDSPYYHSSGTYALTATHTAGSTAGLESEDNDTIQAPDVLSSGLAVEGQLASATDTDRYRIQAAESGVMTIALDVPTADTSNNYFVLQVYDASGTQLAQYRTGQDRTVAVGVPQVGAYDIVVQAESSYRYDGNAYKLTATLAAGGAQGYESEANESATAADADPLSLGGLTRGQLATSSDKDYYQVTVNAKGILTVELDVPTNSTSDKPYRLRLLDTDGAGQLFDNNYGTGQDSTYALELPKAGTYFLELSSYYSSALKESAYALKSSFSAGATGGKELEINDSKADADPISSGVKVSGNLGKSSDEDYYRLDVAAAGVLSVLLDVPSSLSGGGYRYEYFRLSVYDAQDTLLGQYNTSADKTYRIAAQSAGSYYLVVDSPYYHSSETYALTATHTAGSTAGLESEDNDTTQAPDVLSSGLAVEGQLASATDTDRYRIQAAESGVMTIALDVPTADTSNNYFVLQVYDASGTQLAQYRTGQDRTVAVGVPQVGAYDIVVQAESSYRYDGNAYKLTATLAAGGAQGYESEANESATAADADPLNLGGLTRGQLATSSDKDYYQVTVNAKGILTVELDVPTNSTSDKPYRLRLLDTDGAGQLFDNNYGTGQDSTYALELPKAGTYFLELSSYYSSALKESTYALKSSFSAGATGGKELEINDSKADADPISSGVKVSGNLGKSSDEDYYRLDVAAAGVLSVLLDVPSSLSGGGYRYEYFRLSVYDAQDTLLGQYNTSADKTYRFAAETAGSYYLVVDSPYYHSSGTYALTATHTAGSTAGLESEDNDTIQAPDVLSSGLAVEGQLASATDTDRYRIQAAESGVMTIALDVPTADTSNNYFVLQVYDASGTQLAQYRTGQDRTVAVGVPQVGAYDIVVQAESSYRYDGNAYKLTATLAAGGAQGYESEANESATAADADPLSLGGLTRGQLATSSDKDYYQVTVNAKGILTVELDVPTNSTSDKPYRLRLLDTDGAGQLFDNNYGTGQDSTYALELPKAGTYFLELSSYYSSALKESAYALKSSFSAGATGGKELEINDSKADADPISSGVKVSGNLGKSSDEDYYRLDVAAAGVLSVLLDVPSSLSGGGYRYEYFRLSVYDAQDTLLGQYNTSADKTYRIAAQSAGSYYLVVDSPYYHSSETYALTATHTAGSTAGLESEDNDTTQAPDVLSSGLAVEGQLASATDTDRYRIQAAESGVMTIALDVPTADTSNNYFVLQVYDASGTQLAQYRTGQDRTVAVGVPQVGAYDIVVQAESSYRYDGNAYKLTATLAAGGAQGYESEANESATAADADPLNLGGLTRGQLASSRDKDYYQVTVNAKGILTVELDVPTNSTSSTFELTLFDTDGSKTLYSYTTGQDKAYTLPIPKAGTYFIGIESYYSYSYTDSPYSLKPTFTAGGIPGLELESNDTPADADTLPSTEPIKGQIARGSDVDLFKVAAIGPSLLTVNFDSPLGATSYEAYELVVIDSTGRKLFTQFTAGDLNFEVGLPAAGTYYVGVQAGDWYYTSDTYSIKGSLAAAQGQRFETEPNDKTPNVLLAGTKMTGQVASASDVDLYQFSLAGPSQLRLAFDFSGAESTQDRFTIGLFDAAGNLLANRAVSGDVELQAAAGTAGAYFVSISSAGSSFDSNQYTLQLTATQALGGLESEPNNQPTDADALTLGQPMSGQLSTPQDKDWYTLDLTSKGRVAVSMDVPTNSSWGRFFRLEVQDPTGKTLAVRDVGADTSAEFDVGAYGGYRIAVSSPFGSHDDGVYKLLVTANLEDAVPAGALTGTSLGDRLTGTAADNLIYGLGGNDLIDGGAGTDTVVFRASSPNLSINTIGGLTAVRGNFAAGDHAYSVSRLWNAEKIKTWSGTESLNTQAVTPLLGAPQADRLVGTAGNDLIDGLGGSDFIDGGAGTDTLALFGSRDAFSIATIAGITRIRGGEGTGEYAGHVIKLVNVESLGFVQGQTRALQTAEGNRIFGSASGDLLRGTTGDDVIDGQGGADTVDGGAGQDTLVFFGRFSDFSIAYPSTQVPELRVTGKAGTEFAGQVTRIANVETLAFTDTSIPVENPPRVLATAEATTVAEGGTGATLAVALTVKPEDTVTVSLTTGSQLAASINQLSFDANNWNVVQRVTVTAVDDTVLEKRHTGQLTLTPASTDPRYQGQTQTISYSISDNELSDLGSVAGQLWNDLDQDGTVDPGEGPLVGWQVFDDVNRNGKRDTGEVAVITDNSGRYLLDDLSPGAHTIVATAASGWAPTYPTKANWSASVVVNEADSGESGTGEWRALAVEASLASMLINNLGDATNLGAFRTDPRFAQIQGQGVTVVVIDSGIDLDHPAFGPDADRNGIADRIVFQYDFVDFNDANASDVHGHGTHVAGIVGSSDSSFPGVAPQVNLIALRVLDEEGSGSNSDIQEALNWVVANAAKYNVVAVNLSLGTGTFDRYAATGFASSQFRALANSNVIAVAASGNDYAARQVQGVSYPSSDPFSLSVGAVWPRAGAITGQTGRTDAIAYFSQRDDTESDIFAPGVNIGAARNGGGYVELSGTSMASPEIAGMVALAQQLALTALGRRLTFDEVRSLFKSTGDSIVDGDDENDQVVNTGLTFKRVDMMALAEAIIQLPPLISHSVTVVANQAVTGRDFGFSSTAVVQGLSADDLIVGSLGGEVIRGGVGADDIDGGAGDDLIYGEAGNDLLKGSSGDDLIYGEAGDDFLEGGSGDDFMDGGLGTDYAVFSAIRTIATVTFDAAKNEYRISSAADGTDRVTGVETFIFGSQSIAAENLLNAQGDTVAPSVQSFTPSDGAQDVALSSNIVITFSESVSWGTGAIELRVGSATGQLVESFVAGSSRVSVAGSSVSIDPTSNFHPTTKYFVVFGASSLNDLAGNAFAGLSTYDFSSVADTVPPTIAITSSKSALKTGETATISFTLSEASSGFEASDITVTGGVLSNFAGSGGAYTATFTPNANSITSGVISVASDKFSDAAGNLNADGNDLDNRVTIAIDTVGAGGRTGRTKYFVVQNAGGNVFDLQLDYPEVTLRNEAITLVGSTGVDAVYVREGMAVDFTLAGASSDKIYLEGRFADYEAQLTGSVMRLTRKAVGSPESVSFIKAANETASDVVVFSDGTVSSFKLFDYLKAPSSGAPVPAGESSGAPLAPAKAGSALSSKVKAFALNSGGDVFAPMKPGVALTAVGGVGVDKVYVADATVVDATLLGASADVVYLRGGWSEYEKIAAGTTLSLTRVVGGLSEQVKVSAGNAGNNDWLVFADGAVRSADARVAVLANASVGLTAITGFDVNQKTPGLAGLNASELFLI